MGMFDRVYIENAAFPKPMRNGWAQTKDIKVTSWGTLVDTYRSPQGYGRVIPFTGGMLLIAESNNSEAEAFFEEGKLVSVKDPLFLFQEKE